MVIKKLVLSFIAISIVFFVFGCSKPAPVAADGGPVVTMAAPVSDGSEDLKIDSQLNIKNADVENNYFTFSGNIRYMANEMDQADVVSGASKKGSTHVFQAYLYDVEGKYTMSGGLRGLFLYSVNQQSAMIADAVDISKGSDGVITIQYAHRGTAYRILTDGSGNLTFPKGTFEKRNIGYIVGAGPQVLSKDFSADGTSATVDWTKVWDSSVADGKLVDANSDKKTGPIVMDAGAADSMYYYDGKLKADLTNDILTISGSLTAVKR